MTTRRVSEKPRSPSLRATSLDDLTLAVGGRRHWTNPSRADVEVMATREYQDVEHHWRTTRNGVNACAFRGMGWAKYRDVYMGGSRTEVNTRSTERPVDSFSYQAPWWSP